MWQKLWSVSNSRGLKSKHPKPFGLKPYEHICPKSGGSRDYRRIFVRCPYRRLASRLSRVCAFLELPRGGRGLPGAASARGCQLGRRSVGLRSRIAGRRPARLVAPQLRASALVPRAGRRWDQRLSAGQPGSQDRFGSSPNELASGRLDAFGSQRSAVDARLQSLRRR